MDAGWVEPVRRLVEDEQLGIPEYCPGEPKALSHTERIRRCSATSDEHGCGSQSEPERYRSRFWVAMESDAF
jgi:hypothetical protein